MTNERLPQELRWRESGEEEVMERGWSLREARVGMVGMVPRGVEVRGSAKTLG